MIVDLATDERAQLPEFDLAVIGSGPAGLTIVRELAESGLSIACVESGRARPTPRGDRLRATECAGIQIKDYSRERVFGGASTTWAGLSSPLDAIDLEARDYLVSSGWPIERAELLRGYAAAAERFGFAALPAFAPGGFDKLRDKGGWQPRWDGLDEKVFLAAQPPQNWAVQHAQVFARPQVDLFLDASVVALAARGARASVREALVRTSRGRELALRARCFVLATGGIENARLLLLSTDLCPAGLGNERDQVGRWLMNHPKNYHGLVTLSAPVTSAPYYFGCLHQGYAGYAGLRLPEHEQRARGLLNSYVRFEPLFPWSDSIGVESLVSLAKRTKLAVRSLQHRARGRELVELRDYSETGDDSALQNERKGAAGYAGLVWNVLADAPRVSRYAWHRLNGRKQLPIRRARLRNFMEMEPRPEQRVTLGSARDELGLPLPRVSHAPSELDRRSLLALHERLARELPRAGIGTLESSLERAAPWPIDQDASHHMGTTRMGRDPASSVVDADLKLHELDNVFLAGASVFPTSGCANPTFTITALSIRLAEHLRTRVLARSEAAR